MSKLYPLKIDIFSHIVFSGILERYPNLKIITHHCGGMVPYFESRILQQQYYIEQMDISDADRQQIYEDNARTLLRLTI